MKTSHPEYIIKRGHQYFNAGGTAVRSSGYCQNANWVDVRGHASITTDRSMAEKTAQYYGGEVELK